MTKLIIDCIADLHGTYPNLQGGDILIVAGDITGSDKIPQWAEFYGWFKEQNYRKKIMIAGNHDGFLEGCIPTTETEALGLGEDEWFVYLADSFVVFEGIKIYGSPWTPEFFNWHFMLPRGEELKKKWDMIPADTDILVTHGPPHGTLDRAFKGSRATQKTPHCGCEELALAVASIMPRLHVFGHIHGSYGVKETVWGCGKKTLMVNCSQMNEDYDGRDKPIRIEYTTEEVKCCAH